MPLRSGCAASAAPPSAQVATSAIPTCLIPGTFSSTSVQFIRANGENPAKMGSRAPAPADTRNHPSGGQRDALTRKTPIKTVASVLVLLQPRGSAGVLDQPE